MSDAVVWQDLECGAYAADLELWHELAGAAGGPVLELGAGTGRVALELAARGHEVVALDADPELLDELGRRAARRGPAIERIAADVRERLPVAPVGLVLATMQLLHIVGGSEERAALLRASCQALRPGGTFAAAITDVYAALEPSDGPPLLPDVAEHDGWVYSSLPVGVRPDRQGIVVERLRQRVSPAGELDEHRDLQPFAAFTASELEEQARTAGLTPVGRRDIPTTREYVDSMVVICRR